MQTVLPSEFKRGMVILLEGAPQVVEDFHASGTARTKHKLHVRLRNLKNGRLSDRVFAESERVTVADLEQHRVTFSFKQGDAYVFLDTQTFEEFDLTAEQIGERKWFLIEDAEYRALLLDGKLLDIVLPPTVALTVTDTGPAQKGGSDAAWKEAGLETGLQVMVPLFIEKGDRIRVDTTERKYAGKETAERK
jgi:elongation factor P